MWHCQQSQKRPRLLPNLSEIKTSEDAQLFCNNIESYTNRSQEEKIALALSAIPFSESPIAKNIDKFGIEEEKDRIMIALYIASQPWDLKVSENLEKFQITD